MYAEPASQEETNKTFLINEVWQGLTPWAQHQLQSPVCSSCCAFLVTPSPGLPLLGDHLKLFIPLAVISWVPTVCTGEGRPSAVRASLAALFTYVSLDWGPPPPSATTALGFSKVFTSFSPLLWRRCLVWLRLAVVCGDLYRPKRLPWLRET